MIARPGPVARPRRELAPLGRQTSDVVGAHLDRLTIDEAVQRGKAAWAHAEEEADPCRVIE